ncbi:hypothetical protein C8R47DRAFT_1073631 [Mycena vitilis]|nr:hypothetical protein C8R47DRAFT_1073631 [Mycena vitilis]
MSRPQKSAGPRTRPQKRAGRPERRAVTCTDCKTRIEASALRVASVVPTVDRAIMEIIRERVQSLRADIDWTIDADTNVPYCQYEGPACCPPYLIHLAASRAGFSTEVAYLAYLDRSLPKDSNRPPQVILDDDDDPDGSADSIAHARAESPAEQLGGGSSNAPEEICNPDLAEHQAKVMDLQSARGRLVMNRFLHEDPAAKIMLQGVVAALETTVQSEKTKRHQKKELLIELRKRYQDKEAQIQQLNQTIAEIEEGRSRKYPGPVELAHSEICQDQPMLLAAEHPTHPLLVAAGRSASSHSVSWPIDHPLCDLSVLTADELLKLRRSLKSAKAPGYDAPVDLFARWLQVQKQGRIKGVPACGPDWIVDLRDVRGRNTIMPRVPPGPPMTRTTEERAHHRLCLFAVLRVLVIPGKYANIMRRSGISVACEVHFRCIFEKSYARPPTDEDVVRLLASQGLSMELADDSYQFCMNILQAYHGENPDAFGPGVSGVLLELAGKELDISGPPRGLHSQSQDLLPSFHGFEADKYISTNGKHEHDTGKISAHVGQGHVQYRDRYIRADLVALASLGMFVSSSKEDDHFGRHYALRTMSRMPFISRHASDMPPSPPPSSPSSHRHPAKPHTLALLAFSFSNFALTNAFSSLLAMLPPRTATASCSPPPRSPSCPCFSHDFSPPLLPLPPPPPLALPEVAPSPERAVLAKLLRRLLDMGTSPPVARSLFQRVVRVVQCLTSAPSNDFNSNSHENSNANGRGENTNANANANSNTHGSETLDAELLEVFRYAMKSRWPEHFSMESPAALTLGEEGVRGLPVGEFTFMIWLWIRDPPTALFSARLPPSFNNANISSNNLKNANASNTASKAKAIITLTPPRRQARIVVLRQPRGRRVSEEYGAAAEVDACGVGPYIDGVLTDGLNWAYTSSRARRRGDDLPRLIHHLGPRYSGNLGRGAGGERRGVDGGGDEGERGDERSEESADCALRMLRLSSDALGRSLTRLFRREE